MSSLGKATKRAFFKAANDGAAKKTVMADLKTGAAKGEKPKSRANDNPEPGPQAMQKLMDDQAKLVKLVELYDEGNQFALNRYAKKHFGKSWKELKNDPEIKDML